MIELRKDRRRERNKKHQDKLIKSMVRHLSISNQIEKTLPDTMQKVEFNCNEANEDSRPGFFCFQNDIVNDMRMLPQCN